MDRIRLISTTGSSGACPATAKCRQAVTQAYDALRSSGAEDRVAFEAAEAVYAWHHPEVPRRQVPYVIADWLPDRPYIDVPLAWLDPEMTVSAFSVSCFSGLVSAPSIRRRL